MRIEVQILTPAATNLVAVAARDGMTVEQWAARALTRAIPEKVTPIGRPKENRARDAEMRLKRAAGATQAALAKEYGLSRIRVQQICDGRDCDSV